MESFLLILDENKYKNVPISVVYKPWNIKTLVLEILGST